MTLPPRGVSQRGMEIALCPFVFLDPVVAKRSLGVFVSNGLF